MMDRRGWTARLGLTALLLAAMGCGSTHPPEKVPDDEVEHPDDEVETPDNEACEEDFHVSAGTCEPCPEGTGNAPGDNPADGETHCEAHLCDVDTYVASHACVSCSDGETNAAGDDASGEDTRCDPVDACSSVFGLSCDRFEEGYLKASNPHTFARFGGTLALDGDTLVVGAPFESSSAQGVDGEQTDIPATESGAVYVFTRVQGVWRQQAYLKASNADEGDNFGQALAVSGDTIAVGAPREDGGTRTVNGQELPGSPASGAVYVFHREADAWSQQAYLKASNADHGDLFGTSVALDGDRLAIGARFEGSAATGVGGDPTNGDALRSGAAYVFERSEGQWSETAYLKASNTGAEDLFGSSVALDGDTLVVGAPHEDSHAQGVDGDQQDNTAPTSGAVYVFVFEGASWAQQAYIKASNAGAGDVFGLSIALDGDTLAVGAHAEDGGSRGVNGADSDMVPDSGAVYVFVRDGTTWGEQAYIKASNGWTYDRFGTSVRLHGDTLAVGAEEDSGEGGLNGEGNDLGAPDSGAVYLFRRAGETWTQQAYLKAAIPGADDGFGDSVALSGTTLVVAAPGEDGSAIGVDGDPTERHTPDSGAAFIFRIAP